MEEELNQRYWHIVDSVLFCAVQEEIFGPVLFCMEVLLIGLFSLLACDFVDQVSSKLFCCLTI